MNPIKLNREKLGLTQQSLADQSGLSLRTIQRLENSDKPPKGHTLQQLAALFKLSTEQLKTDFSPEPKIEENGIQSVKLINASALALFVFPFGNLIFPFLVWRAKRHQPLADEVGRRILNFQIYWTVFLAISLCLSPFLDSRNSDSLPLILKVLFVVYLINLFVTLWNAWKIQKGEYDLPTPPIRLI